MLEVRRLRKFFGSLNVARDVTLALAPGERRAVIGPNGAGKTTLFNIIAGDLQPISGAIFLEGRNITRLAPDARARLGLARSFQRNNLFLDMTVAWCLAVAIAIRKRRGGVFWRSFESLGDVHAESERLAVEVGLAAEAGAVVRSLSYGSQRQLEVALAFAGKRRVLLLDEPTAGMSPQETAAMLVFIAGVSRDLSILLIEHDIDVVFGVADRVTVLDQGRVVAEGSPSEIRASPLVQDIYLGRNGTFE